jgi:outer membrane protein OmpA-like peptidoglycan-associated protein
VRNVAAVLVTALLLSGCAGPSLLLLPDEGGDQGAVAVLESRGKAQESVIRRGNTRTSLRAARPSTRLINPARLSAAERALLANLPPAAKTFPLFFEEGTAIFTAESQLALTELRAEVARRPGAEVEVTGHTDREGSEDANDELSQRRAELIVGILAGEGIPRELMTAVGRGERQPRVPTPDGVAEPANRRVEVTIR